MVQVLSKQTFLESVLIRFMAGKLLSHSAVLTGITSALQASFVNCGYIVCKVLCETSNLSIERSVVLRYVEEIMCFKLTHSDRNASLEISGLSPTLYIPSRINQVVITPLLKSLIDFF